MKKTLQIFIILSLSVIAIVLSVYAGDAEVVEGVKVRFPAALGFGSEPADSSPILSTACALKPLPKTKKPAKIPPAIRGEVPLSRFRQTSSAIVPPKADLLKTEPSYTPREVVALAHPTNFGRRFVQDFFGRPVGNEPIVVLHETVGSAQGTIGLFQTAHPNDDDQVSYHTVITEDGTIVYTVPPDKRAFGAGNSIFAGPIGDEAVKTNPVLPPSVNNFAYHISLVTPRDGRNNASRHSGYTRAQYQSLAWLVAKTGVPDSRITTHRLVDRSRQRQDPRSFDGQYFLRLLSFYPKTNDISTQCSIPVAIEE
ncbi:MAG: N-acetylmuramoyl-L-alanine amidase [Leptolyngbyaceae cyanobacterium CSU_1_3]|nr:N-acetylmuramoyl-L-alanine amidase [Leptolyngbyaceae cyanobacterium CSU_1_3]